MENFLIVINKDEGMTSRDVVNKLGKILNNKKIGHTGTLDPLATGVLVCVGGKYTKLVNLITALEKEYIAEIKLGIKTDTLDITGCILAKEKVQVLTNAKIEKVLATFEGKITQTVPLYSAVFINGKRLYEYAHEKKEVKLPKREVEIKKIELITYHDDTIKIRVVCSKGTYIRSLIADICSKLNVLGTMSSLKRVRQGNFKINESYTLEDVINNNYKLLSIEDILPVKVVSISKNDAIYKKVINGNKLEMAYQDYILFKEQDKEIALYNFQEKIGHLLIKIA